MAELEYSNILVWQTKCCADLAGGHEGVSDISIRVRQDLGKVRFHLSSPVGAAARISSLVVSDEDSQRHCWLIVPGAAGGSIDLQYELEKRMAAAGLMVPEGVDPIEDLPPSDPRRKVAEAHMMDAGHLLHPLVSFVEYGTLPVGFQQVLPRDSDPVPLRSGRRYRVLVLGAPMDENEASTIFEAR